MAATLVNIGDLIAVNSDRPMIAGTRTAVGRIATLHQQGYSVDEIVADKDYLSLAQVYAALAYYFANQRQIDEDLAAEAAEYDRLAAQVASHTQRGDVG
jgi:uncharacterized protein (DUF433 family)